MYLYIINCEEIFSITVIESSISPPLISSPPPPPQKKVFKNDYFPLHVMHMSTNYGPNDNYFAIIKYLICHYSVGFETRGAKIKTRHKNESPIDFVYMAQDQDKEKSRSRLHVVLNPTLLCR